MAVRGRKPKNHRKPYSDGEIALIYLVDRSPRSQEKLRKLLHRRVTAIDFINSWKEGKDFKKSSFGAIRRQLMRAKKILGPEKKNVIAL